MGASRCGLTEMKRTVIQGTTKGRYHYSDSWPKFIVLDLAIGPESLWKKRAEQGPSAYSNPRRVRVRRGLTFGFQIQKNRRGLGRAKFYGENDGLGNGDPIYGIRPMRRQSVRRFRTASERRRAGYTNYERPETGIPIHRNDAGHTPDIEGTKNPNKGLVLTLHPRHASCGARVAPRVPGSTALTFGLHQEDPICNTRDTSVQCLTNEVTR